MTMKKQGSPVKVEVVKQDLKKVAEQFKDKKDEDLSKKDKPEQPK